MDKNTIAGFVLIAALLIGFSWYTKPSDEEIAIQKTRDSIENVARKKAELQKQTVAKSTKEEEAKADTTQAFYKAQTGKNEDITLQNDKVA